MVERIDFVDLVADGQADTVSIEERGPHFEK